MATRYTKDKSIAHDTDEQRTEKPAMRGKPMKAPEPSFRKCDHSGKKYKGQMGAQGFKEV